jgi:hypothetical protein
VGAIDLPSESLFLAANSHIKVFEKVLEFDGGIEMSASLEDQNRTWVAFGGYDMNSCAVVILDGLFELRGGFRIVPLQGAAARGAARIRAEVDVCGIGGGYSFSIAAMGQIGWNPVELGGQLDVGGSVWIKTFGTALGVGVDASLALQLPKPKQLSPKVECTFDLPWPLSSIKIPHTIFAYKDDQVNAPLAGLALAVGFPIGFFHACSGTNGQLGVTPEKVWPDVSFELPFLRSARGPGLIVNRSQGDGVTRVAGSRPPTPR